MFRWQTANFGRNVPKWMSDTDTRGGRGQATDIMKFMFFRRERPKNPTFQDRVEALKKAGFAVAPLSGQTVRVTRGSCAADIRPAEQGVALEARAGILIGSELASLVDGGYQKFFRSAGGIKKPAMAEELVDLHNFEEDLRETLGIKSLYNEALGTVSAFYQYDRLEDRDRGVPKRIWE